MVPVGKTDGIMGQIFGGKLGFVGRLDAHVFVFYLMDFLVYLQIHGPAHGESATGQRVPLALRLYLLFKAQTAAGPPGVLVKLLFQPDAALGGQVVTGLLRLAGGLVKPPLGLVGLAGLPWVAGIAPGLPGAVAGVAVSSAGRLRAGGAAVPGLPLFLLGETQAAPAALRGRAGAGIVPGLLPSAPLFVTGQISGPLIQRVAGGEAQPSRFIL